MMQEADTHTPSGLPRTRIVVLGSGWGAISFLRSLDPKLTSGMPPISLISAKGSDVHCTNCTSHNSRNGACVSLSRQTRKCLLLLLLLLQLLSPNASCFASDEMLAKLV